VNVGSVSVSIEKKNAFLHPGLEFGRSSLLAAITAKQLDVLDICYERSNWRLGVNGDPGHRGMPCAIAEWADLGVGSTVPKVN